MSWDVICDVVPFTVNFGKLLIGELGYAVYRQTLSGDLAMRLMPSSPSMNMVFMSATSI